MRHAYTSGMGQHPSVFKNNFWRHSSFFFLSLLWFCLITQILPLLFPEAPAPAVSGDSSSRTSRIGCSLRLSRVLLSDSDSKLSGYTCMRYSSASSDYCTANSRIPADHICCLLKQGFLFLRQWLKFFHIRGIILDLFRCRHAAEYHPDSLKICGKTDCQWSRVQETAVFSLSVILIFAFFLSFSKS